MIVRRTIWRLTITDLDLIFIHKPDYNQIMEAIREEWSHTENLMNLLLDQVSHQKYTLFEEKAWDVPS